MKNNPLFEDKIISVLRRVYFSISPVFNFTIPRFYYFSMGLFLLAEAAIIKSQHQGPGGRDGKADESGEN
jgi:hypothetical protein